MNYRKYVVFLLGAYVLYFMVSQPAETLGLARRALAGVDDAAGKLAAFVRHSSRNPSTSEIVVLGCLASFFLLMAAGWAIADWRRSRRLEARRAENRRRANQIGSS